MLYAMSRTCDLHLSDRHDKGVHPIECCSCTQGIQRIRGRQWSWSMCAWVDSL